MGSWRGVGGRRICNNRFRKGRQVGVKGKSLPCTCTARSMSPLAASSAAAITASGRLGNMPCSRTHVRQGWGVALSGAWGGGGGWGGGLVRLGRSFQIGEGDAGAGGGGGSAQGSRVQRNTPCPPSPRSPPCLRNAQARGGRPAERRVGWEVASTTLPYEQKANTTPASLRPAPLHPPARTCSVRLASRRASSYTGCCRVSSIAANDSKTCLCGQARG